MDTWIKGRTHRKDWDKMVYSDVVLALPQKSWYEVGAPGLARPFFLLLSLDVQCGNGYSARSYSYNVEDYVSRYALGGVSILREEVVVDSRRKKSIITLTSH